MQKQHAAILGTSCTSTHASRSSSYLHSWIGGVSLLGTESLTDMCKNMQHYSGEARGIFDGGAIEKGTVQPDFSAPPLAFKPQDNYAVLHTNRNDALIFARPSAGLEAEGHASLSRLQVLHSSNKGMTAFDQSQPPRSRRRGGKRHRANKKYDKAGHEIKVFFGNVTAWSTHASHYVATADVDVALIAETHLESGKLQLLRQELKKLGWSLSGAPAERTCEHGTSAGCLAMVRDHCYNKPLSHCTDMDGTISPGHRLTGRTIKIRDTEFLMLSAYFLVEGDMAAPTNVDILREVV